MASNKLGETLEAEEISIGKLRQFVFVSESVLKELVRGKKTVSPALEAGIVWAINKVTGKTYRITDVFPKAKRPNQALKPFFRPNLGGGGTNAPTPKNIAA